MSRAVTPSDFSTRLLALRGTATRLRGVHEADRWRQFVQRWNLHLEQMDSNAKTSPVSARKANAPDDGYRRAT